MWYRGRWCFAVGLCAIGGTCGWWKLFGGVSLGVQQGQTGELKVLPKQKGPNHCWLGGPKSSNPESRRSNKRKRQLPGFVQVLMTSTCWNLSWSWSLMMGCSIFASAWLIFFLFFKLASYPRQVRIKTTQMRTRPGARKHWSSIDIP